MPKRKTEIEEATEAFNRGYTKGYLDGFDAGQKEGMKAVIKAFAHMQGDYGEGKLNDNQDNA